jgi:hypothetical protein
MSSDSVCLIQALNRTGNYHHGIRELHFPVLELEQTVLVQRGAAAPSTASPPEAGRVVHKW